MISPLASPFRGGWRNLTPMRARGRGVSGQWNPAYIPSLIAWWHGTDLDGSQAWAARVGGATFGTAQSGSTTGSDANDPDQVSGQYTTIALSKYWEVADNSGLDFGATDSFTGIVVASDLGPAAATSTFFAKATAFTGVAGWTLGFTSTTVFARISDGTTNIASPSGARPSSKATIAMVRNGSGSKTLGLFINGVSAGTATSDTTSGTLSNSAVLRFGRLSGAGTNYGDHRMYGFLLFNAALDATTLAQITAWYGI